MARRKNVKRIDPRYFLHETVNRGTGLIEGCPSEEEGEAIDISGPGVELHVDDIGDLPPDEAFAAGLAAARDAIDQILGDSEEDLPEEELIALAEQIVLQELGALPLVVGGGRLARAIAKTASISKEPDQGWLESGARYRKRKGLPPKVTAPPSGRDRSPGDEKDRDADHAERRRKKQEKWAEPTEPPEQNESQIHNKESKQYLKGLVLQELEDITLEEAIAQGSDTPRGADIGRKRGSFADALASHAGSALRDVAGQGLGGDIDWTKRKGAQQVGGNLGGTAAATADLYGVPGAGDAILPAYDAGSALGGAAHDVASRALGLGKRKRGGSSSEDYLRRLPGYAGPLDENDLKDLVLRELHQILQEGENE